MRGRAVAAIAALLVLSGCFGVDHLSASSAAVGDAVVALGMAQGNDHNWARGQIALIGPTGRARVISTGQNNDVQSVAASGGKVFYADEKHDYVLGRSLTTVKRRGAKTKLLDSSGMFALGGGKFVVLSNEGTVSGGGDLTGLSSGDSHGSIVRRIKGFFVSASVVCDGAVYGYTSGGGGGGLSKRWELWFLGDGSAKEPRRISSITLPDVANGERPDVPACSGHDIVTVVSATNEKLAVTSGKLLRWPIDGSPATMRSIAVPVAAEVAACRQTAVRDGVYWCYQSQSGSGSQSALAVVGISMRTGEIAGSFSPHVGAYLSNAVQFYGDTFAVVDIKPASGATPQIRWYRLSDGALVRRLKVPALARFTRQSMNIYSIAAIRQWPSPTATPTPSSTAAVASGPLGLAEPDS